MALLNSFVDSIVCVGFSSERGLKLDSEAKDNESIFSSPLQPSLLSIVTATYAMYPLSRDVELIDPDYPPIDRTNSYSSTTSSTGSDRSTSASLIATGTRSPKQSIPPAYNNLPLFCFPDGVRATYQKENERIHHIVFTQEEGKRIYALALTFQQSFTLKTDKPDEDGVYQIENYRSPTSTLRRSSVSKIPIAIDRQLSATSTQSSTVKIRSKKMPSSFQYAADTSSNTRSRSSSTSNDTSKQHRHYETHTISSSQKDSSGRAKPPSRMVRTNSQNSLTSSTSTTSNGTGGEVRKRSSSNTSRILSNNINSAASSMSKPIEITKPFYLSHCIVLVSSQPYWTSMQETISIIHDEMTRLKIEPNSSQYKQLIQKYAFLACNTPTPPIPSEHFSLSFNLTNDQSVLSFDPPIDINHTVLDLDLSILPLTLNIGKLLDVLAVVFTQQPIIFFSTNYSKLVTTLECLLYLIYPLKWAHVYVPFVPYGLRDYYLEGPPGSYIMGAHSRHQSIVENHDMSFTCNLDNDKNIYIPKNMAFHHLPPTKTQHFVGRLTTALEEIKVARSLQNVHTPLRLRIDQQREFERQQRLETNHKIIKIFIDLMVDLYGDALKPIYWRINQQQSSPSNTLAKPSDRNQTKTTFSKEKYLLSKTEGVELEFYRTFIDTAAFQTLMEEEIKSTSPTVFRRICQLHSLSDESQYYHFNHASVEGNDDGEDDEGDDEDEDDAPTTLYDSMASQMLLPLPNWPSNMSKHYLDNCIELFTNELEGAHEEHTSAVKTVYAYLRGCALLARGKYLEGLQDLYSIDDPSLFPRTYIETTILPILYEECLTDIFFNEPYYAKAPEWKKVHLNSESRNMTIIDLEKSGNSLDDTTIQSSNEVEINNEWIMTETNLTYEQFSEYAHRSGIVLDNETTQKLFNALMNWTDSTLTQTLKQNKTPANTPTRPRTTTTNRLEDTFVKLADSQRANQTFKSSTQPVIALPATLFETFLDNWQCTNAEKIRMSRYLPEDRHKKESILKVSSSGIISKADGPGQLILTQKRIYFLPEARSFARLLTEIINIASVEKYQHQTVFSSSKPGIKINTATSRNTPLSSRDSPHSTLKAKTSSLEKNTKTSIRLIFKNTQEQELWHIIIMEIWSGSTIAHEQCDTALLNKASRHIALMDTLSNIDYAEVANLQTGKSSANTNDKLKQSHHEASVEKALNDLATFTQMRQTGSLKPLSVETRNVLTRRLSPSINEVNRHAICCLAFTKNPENGSSSLWCAYGSKIKVYNIATWVCDPNDITFPSLITCMQLDSRNKLWVGCVGGQVFVVDTVTHICGPQLASINGEGGCRSVAFDEKNNRILTASRSSSVIIWNASNWERLNDINLCELYRTSESNQEKTFKSSLVIKLRSNKLANQNRKQKLLSEAKPSDENPSTNITPVIPSPMDKLERIQVYDKILFGCYCNDYILSIRISDSNTYTYGNLISVKYKDDATPIDSFTAYKKQLWISAGCIISIFSINDTDSENSYNLLMKKPVDDDRLVTMIGFSDYICAGSLKGNVYLFRMDNYELFRTFAGHYDSVCSLCSVLDIVIISGSAQNDTSIAVWENVQTPSSGTKELPPSLVNAAIKQSTINSPQKVSNL